MLHDFPFQLSIAPEIEFLRPEIDYVCNFITKKHFLIQTDDANRTLHYGINPPLGALNIPDFLSKYLIIGKTGGIHLDRNKFEIGIGKTGKGLLPVGKIGTNYIEYDAFGLIFFMLSRIEESDYPELDSHQRFPYSSAFAVKHGWHNTPLADRAAFDVANALTGESKPSNRTTFSVRLTHDVDRLRSYHQIFRPIRTATGHLLKRKQPKIALKLLSESYFTNEPSRSFSRIMDHSEKRGLASQFNFMGPTRVTQDSPYALKYRSLLAKIIKSVVVRGHVLGFHPGYYTFDDPIEWSRQKKGLEEIAKNIITFGRQHVLRFNVDVTPNIWEHFGMLHDATLAFPEESGFRPGTCISFQAYSLKERRALNLKMGASAINEFGLFGGKYNNFSIEQALDECQKTIDNCRKYGGELIILFHTGWDEKNPVWVFYKELLNEIT